MEAPFLGSLLVASLVLQLVDDVDAKDDAHELEATQHCQHGTPHCLVVV